MTGNSTWTAHVIPEPSELNGVWSVVLNDGDGYTSQRTIFRGPDSERRAREYAVWLTIGWTKGQDLVSQFFSLPVRMTENEARVAALYRKVQELDPWWDGT